MVRHGVHETPLGQPLQPVSKRGGWDAAEARQLVHGGQGGGAQQQDRLLQPLAQGAQGGVRPQALQVDDDLERGRLNRRYVPTDGVQGRRRARSAPCGLVRGTATGCGGTRRGPRLPCAVHAATRRRARSPRTALLRSGPACVAPFNTWVLGSVTINRLLHSAMAQLLILDGKLLACNALQGIVLEAVLW